MEKYGVHVPDEGTKVSEDLKTRTKCSRCSRELETSANVPKCPVCGTEPAETER